MVFLDAEIKRLRDNVERTHQAIVNFGRIVFILLDQWQEVGASYQELCNLCCCNYSRVCGWMEEKADRTWSFSDLIFVRNLDFHNEKADFLEFETDAPLTHGIKEYLLDQMLHNKDLKKASRRAFAECFPDLWDKCMHEATDAEGNRVLVDKDGEIVGYLNNDEED